MRLEKNNWNTLILVSKMSNYEQERIEKVSKIYASDSSDWTIFLSFALWRIASGFFGFFIVNLLLSPFIYNFRQ